MSAIVCFDIRNFSTHVSHLAAGNQGKSKKVFEVVKSLFQFLDRAIVLTKAPSIIKLYISRKVVYVS